VDAWVLAIGQSLPQMGAFGLFVTIILLLLRRESATEVRHASEMQRQAKIHDEELAELINKNKELRKDIDALDTRLRSYREGSTT
jgi:hypothetical protein